MRDRVTHVSGFSGKFKKSESYLYIPALNTLPPALYS